MNNTSLFLGMAVLIVPTYAAAQQSIAGVQSETDSSPEAAAHPQDGLDEIVVTAQHRSEKLKDVPLTIDSVPASQLEKAGVTSVRDLATLVAGFSSGGQGTVSQPSIRGVSTLLSVAGADNPNALYVDGIYFAVPTILNNEIPDLDHVEVLKGPQGTLFGRNATGGAVQIFTRQPTFDTHVDMNVDIGDYTGNGGSRSAPHISGRAFVTGGLTNDIAASLSAGYSYTPGYLKNDAYGTRDGEIRKSNLRGKLLFTPSSNITITASGYYTKNNLVGELLGTPFVGLSAASQYPGSIVPSQPWHVAYDDGADVAALKVYGGSLKAQATLDPGTLTLLTGYNNTQSHTESPVDGARGTIACLANAACIDYDQGIKDREISQEADFASRRFGILSFTAGLYYYDAKGGTVGIIQKSLIPGGITVQDAAFSTKAYAAYSEVTVRPLNGLSVTGGLRYGYERKDDSPDPTLPNVKKNFKSLIPRASIKYDLNRNTSIYATYSEGYKSGLTGATNTANGFLPVAPERLYSYEAGIKYAAHNVTLDLSGFYYNYRNKQEQTFLGTSELVVNTGPVRIYGLDADGNYRITPSLSLQGNVSYIPVAKYLDFKNASGNSTITVPFAGISPATPFGCVPFGGCGGYFPGHLDVPGSTFDATGYRLTRAPKLSASSTISYQRDLSRGVFDSSLTISYTSKVFPETTHLIVQRSFVTLNGQLGYMIRNSGVRLGIYGHNLTNKRYIIALTESSGGFFTNYGSPREVGVLLGYSF